MEQEIIHIHFVPNYTSGTVSPSAPQYGGMQGDRDAAEVTFTVPSALRGSSFRYRIEGEDGAGGFVTTELLPLDDEGCVTTLLDERFTAAGGQILLRLVVEGTVGDHTVTTARSFDARVYFKDAPTAPGKNELCGSLTQIFQKNEERLKKTDDKVDGFEDRLDAVDTRIDVLENDVVGLDARAGLTNTAIETINGQIRLLDDSVRGLKETTVKKEMEAFPWHFVQQVVRAGIASRIFNVGEFFTTNHQVYGPLLWRIVGFNVDHPVVSDYSHSMTLELVDCLHLPSGAFDTREYDTARTGMTHGNSEWELSCIHQWLNSTEAGGAWYDGSGETPSYAGMDGFMRGFSDSFLTAIGRVKKDVAKNSTYSTHTGQSNDWFFLPSRVELYGGKHESNVAEGSVYSIYRTRSNLSAASPAADANRVKMLNNQPVAWMTRSVDPTASDKVAYVGTDGSITYGYASASRAVAPMCCIV